MCRRSLNNFVLSLFSLPTDSPELLKEQFIALSRLIPLMYFILVVNTWMLTLTFMGQAPDWLTIYVAGALSFVCVGRLFIWWRKRNKIPTTEQIIKDFKRTTVLAALLVSAFTTWGFALFPYGDPISQSHIAFYIAVSMLGAMVCLSHLRPASIIVAVIATISFVALFATQGVPEFFAMAINLILVSVAAAIIIVLQNKDFAQMVDARIEARRKHQEQHRLLRMIDNMPVPVMTVDPEDLTVNYMNQTFRHTLGQIEHLLPMPIDDIMGSSFDKFHKIPGHQRSIIADPEKLPYSGRIHLGPEVIDLQVAAIADEDGGFIGPMLTWEIVTKEVEAETRIQWLAHNDTLTGLANRNTFLVTLSHALARAGHENSLFFIDLDGFKNINDTLGHLVGDELLKRVADRLVTTCSAQDMTVARLGGDEFAVLAQGLDIEGAELLAENLIEGFVAPFYLSSGRRIQINASIGIARAPQHGRDAETVLARADLALYAAKAAGKRTFRLFQSEMEDRVQERMRLESELRDSLKEQSGLFVFYQPIIDIRVDKVVTREALIRWHHIERGWVSPGQFIPVAEESDLIAEIGAFVLTKACRDAAAWTDGASVAVNVSAAQLGKGILVSSVLKALVESGLSPGRLELEVTESAILHDEVDCISELRQIRNMGVRVALDDFGTGFSSLSHLRTFPFDKIKIDGSFVKDAVAREDCAAVVKAVADLGKRLGVTIVAEGVETEAHLNLVVEEGCVEVQGFHFGRPSPSETDLPAIAAAERLMADQKVVRRS